MKVKSAYDLIERICRKLELRFDLIMSKTRKVEVIRHRRAFMKLLTDVGMTNSSVGKVFEKSHCNVICSNRVHKDLLDIKDKPYIAVYEKLRREFIYYHKSVDNTIHTLLDIALSENTIRHDELIFLTRENERLKNDIKYLKNQLNILTK